MIWLVAVPLTLAVAAALVGPRLAPRLAVPGIAAMLAVTYGSLATILTHGPQRVALGGFAAPLGIELYGDGLGALMIGTTTVVGALIVVYARGYFRLAEGGARFWALAWMLWASMNALYLSADIFNLYVTLELLALASIGLIGLGGGAVALAAALRYLLAALLGSAAYLLGVALLYGAHGTLALRELAAVLTPGPYASLVLALMSTGLALKTALFPLHFWLPPAHGAALTPVSALLSGLVVKASFYLLLRLWFDLFGAAAGPLAGQALGVLGAGAIVWGALAALRQKKLKMLVAYSTVAQVGYFFLLFPMASTGLIEPAIAAWTGGTLYAVSHAFAKAGMFLAAGAIVHAWGEDDIDHLEGTSARLPLALAAFALAGVTLMGLPPSGGFIGKWLLLRSAFDTGQWWWVIVLLAGGVLTAVYVFRVLRSAFVPPVPERELHPIPFAMQWSAFALAAASVLIGLAADAPARLLVLS